MKMVRSDLASSGVIFTLDTETGFRDVVFITGAYGLGENIVQGQVNPDEFYVFKPTFREGYKPIIQKKLGSKEIKMIYGRGDSKVLTRTWRFPKLTGCASVLTMKRCSSLPDMQSILKTIIQISTGNPGPWISNGQRTA
jgi:phosphoenolpyruvate synthase/pyruvate phosphate dikinase